MGTLCSCPPDCSASALAQLQCQVCNCPDAPGITISSDPQALLEQAVVALFALICIYVGLQALVEG